MIDEGTLLVFRSASGAFTCRKPPLPLGWNPIDRPHVAQLITIGSEVFRVFLSSPKDEEQGKDESLEVSDIGSLPVKSIIEVKIDCVEFNYYRLDNGLWTKVAESRDPFAIEVFSHGTIPIVIDMIQ
ncbi:MAG: hypothetical protein ACTSQZ_05905 [Candidatus Thorarchaeota archaeon]